jgi:hypothetical protein
LGSRWLPPSPLTPPLLRFFSCYYYHKVVENFIASLLLRRKEYAFVVELLLLGTAI